LNLVLYPCSGLCTYTLVFLTYYLKSGVLFSKAQKYLYRFEVLPNIVTGGLLM
jgi:hypothetical protein